MLKKKILNKKLILLLLSLIVFFTIIFVYTIPSGFGIYKSIKHLTVAININKPVFAIKLDNQGADIGQGTEYIYEKHAIGFYLNSDATTQMTTSSNGITPPEKYGYIFQGYYTQTNGAGVRYIDGNGKLTSSANFSNFTSNATLYAYYKTPEYLYDVLKNAAVEGTYASEYTGPHQDSIDASKSTATIYHWYGSNETNGTAILDKNNVIFAEHCWQMIRTTDTGGVRMIYNGEAVNNQCLNTRGTHIGYIRYQDKDLSTSYWYGTDYYYDSTNKVFSLSGTTEQATWNETTWPSLIGKYTCMQTTEDGTCSTLYLVESNNYKQARVLPLDFSSHYSQIGETTFNYESYVNDMGSPARLGYMYNTVYKFDMGATDTYYSVLSRMSLSTSYWYAHNVVWNSTTGKYELDNPYQVSATTDYSNLVGEYTFFSSDQTYTESYVSYIAAVDDSNYYYQSLASGHNLEYYIETYTYGDSYTDNGDKTFTINNPTTISSLDWYTNSSNVKNKYVCRNASNNTCIDLWYITDVYKNYIYYVSLTYEIKYAKGFSYDSNTNTYTLNDELVSFWDIRDSTNRASLNNAHYTCLNSGGSCTRLFYVLSYPYDSGFNLYGIYLTGGKSVEDVLVEMLSANDVNTKNSVIKTAVDAWYKKYLNNNYDKYIDDTIYCNNRSINNLGAWNPNGGKLDYSLSFEQNRYLSCTNVTDRFSISNPSAQLTYKVGLMSYSEMNLLNQNNARKTGEMYFLASPANIKPNYGYIKTVSDSGTLSAMYSNASAGVRPVISLVSGMKYYAGDGSMANPYIVDTYEKYTIKYDSNGGTGTMLDQVVRENETINLSAKLFEKEGYAFEAWNTKADGTGIRYEDGQTVTNLGSPNETITLYAIWMPIITYNIRYNPNGGTGIMNMQEFQYGETKNIESNEFSYENFIFRKWNTKADGTGTDYFPGQAVKNLTEIDNDIIELYAIWTSKIFEYAGEYVFDGTNYIDTGIPLFSDELLNENYEVSFEIVSRGSNNPYATMMSCMDETGSPWPGMVYRIKTNSSDHLAANTNNSINVDKSYPNSNITKVSIKRINKILYIALNDGNYTQVLDMTNLTKTFDVPLTFGASLDGSGNPQRYFKGTLKNLRVIVGTYAEYTIKYDANGGTGTMPDQVIQGTETVNLSANLFEKEGYIFASWNTKADGTGINYKDEQTITSLVATREIITLYARWIPIITYNIRYNPNGGIGIMNMQEFKYGETKNIESNEFSHENLKFWKWNTKADGTGTDYLPGQAVKNLTEIDNDIIELYAIWVVEIFEYAGEYVFDGTNYIDTGIHLFSDELVEKDFEVSFEIVSRGSNKDVATMMSCIDETGSPWPGMVYRIKNSTSDQLAANTNTSIKVDKSYPNGNITKVSLKRTNKILYIAFNNGDYSKVLDMTQLIKTFDVPVTFGASLTGIGSPQRYFEGTLKNMQVLVFKETL